MDRAGGRWIDGDQGTAPDKEQTAGRALMPDKPACCGRADAPGPAVRSVNRP